MRVYESWEARVCTKVLSTFMRRSNEVRVDESGPLTARVAANFNVNKVCKIFSIKFCLLAFLCHDTVAILQYFAEPATTKNKPVVVLQLSLTLMTGQTRTNSHQLSSKFEPVQSR